MKTGIYWQDPKYALRPGRDFIFDPSLVLYLPLGKLDGASFMSKEARGYLCTVTGASWRPGGREFDGSDDKIVIPHHTSLNPPEFTVEAWIKPDVAAKGSVIVGKFHHTNSEGYVLFQHTTYGLTGYVYGSGGYVYARGASSLTAGQWYHAAYTYNGSVLNLYRDSQNKDLNRVAPNYDVSSEDLVVGQRTDSPSATYAFDGVIGEVRIYNRALTSLEIQRNYLATKWRYQ